MPTNARLLRPDVIDRSPMIEQEHFKQYEANDTTKLTIPSSIGKTGQRWTN